MDHEQFSNPLAPPSLSNKTDETNNSKTQPLTNDDFRKLMMTPRVLSGSNQSSVPGSVRGKIQNNKSDFRENQKKKKKFYESIRKHEDDVLSELAKKYRDRAKERRDGTNTEYGQPTDSASEPMTNTAYHAVGPSNFDMDAAERRKLMIQESKYLGGDMEHTHLVKGLDYALLQKVKAEIQNKEDKEKYSKIKQEEEAKREEEQKKKNLAGLSKVADITFDDKDRYAVKSKVAENILKAVFDTKLPERNELFVQGRMAYQYNLDDLPESDIPTTIIRSKAECPNLDAYSSINTNEIVINKIIQIWQDIRQGKKNKKPKMEVKVDRDQPTKMIPKGDSIYDDIGDYVPNIKPKSESRKSSSKNTRHSYFETKSEDQDTQGEGRSAEQRALEMAASVVGSFASTSKRPINVTRSKSKHEEPDSYAECYPGAPENEDAVMDSDDEADFSKMATGTGKASLNRWDFDTAEEYSDYMSSREAMPKAAFQYGMKINDARGKGKRLASKKEEKAKLDRDLQRINAIIAKRKQGGQEISMSEISDDYNNKKKAKN